jgi:hypothetical protein
MMFLDTFRAVQSVASCFLPYRRERPRTALRTLCVGAFDYVNRVNGQWLGQEDRRPLSCLLDLGALINDHFDQHRFCKRTYRQLRKQLSADEGVRTVYRAYFRELRRVERNRPRLRLPCRAGMLKEVANYREQVVRISLSALAAIALGRPGDVPRPPAFEDACLESLFALVMLIQICDDLLDWRNDWHESLPTFATAALLQCKGQAEGHCPDFRQARTSIETMAAAYLAAMPKQKNAFRPFVLCAYATLFLVKLLGRLALRGNAMRKTADMARLESLQIRSRC